MYKGLKQMARQRKITRTYTNAVGYLRTSKEDGETKKGIDSQRDFILDYAERNNIAIVAWTKDDGISGKTPLEYREGLSEAFEMLKTGVADILLTYDITRIARDIGVFGSIRSELQKIGAKGLTSEDDEYTNEDDEFSSFKAVFSEMERKKIAKRLYGGRRVRSKKDGMGSGMLPFGYIRNTNNAIVVDNKAVDTIKAVYTLRIINKCTYAATVKELNSNNILSPNGKEWGNSGIQAIERQFELYTTGKRTWGNVEASEVWPIIIEP